MNCCTYTAAGDTILQSLLRSPPQNEKAFQRQFLEYLQQSLKPATRARDIMSRNIHTIQDNVSLIEASRFLEKVDSTGIPVLNNQGIVAGFLSLRDIMKGRRASQMNASVRAYMTKEVVTADEHITMREVEQIFYKHHISHIPIVEDGKLLGIVSHGDYLRYKKQQGLNELGT